MFEPNPPLNLAVSKAQLLRQGESMDVSKLGGVVAYLIGLSDWVHEAGKFLKGGIRAAALEIDDSILKLANKMSIHCRNSESPVAAGFTALHQQLQEFRSGLALHANAADKLYAHILLEKFQARWDENGNPNLATDVRKLIQSYRALTPSDPGSEELVRIHYEALRRQAVPGKLALKEARHTASTADEAQQNGDRWGLIIRPTEWAFIKTIVATGVAIVQDIADVYYDRGEEPWEDLIHRAFKKRDELKLGSLEAMDNMAIVLCAIANDLLPNETVDLAGVKDELKNGFWFSPPRRSDISFVYFDPNMYQNLLEEFGLGIDFKSYANEKPRAKLYYLSQLADSGERYGPALQAYQNSKFRDRFMPMLAEMVISGADRANQSELHRCFSKIHNELESMEQGNKLQSFLEYHGITSNQNPHNARQLAFRQMLRINREEVMDLVVESILCHPSLHGSGLTEERAEHSQISDTPFVIDPGGIAPSFMRGSTWEDYWKVHAFAVATQLLKQRRNQVHLAEMLYHRLIDHQA